MEPTNYEFAVLKQTLFNGCVIYTPVVRKRQRFVKAKWERIICLYGMYLIQDLDFNPNLTYEQCEQHITGYKQTLCKCVENNIKQTELNIIK